VLYDPTFNRAQGELSGVLKTVFGNSLEILPRTFRLSSEGTFTAIIESADGKAPEIVPSTIVFEINGLSLDVTTSLEFGDVDSDGDLDLIVKFSRRHLRVLIPPDVNSVMVVARWSFRDGTQACASSEIRVSR
jgi:hypothetical protein